MMVLDGLPKELAGVKNPPQKLYFLGNTTLLDKKKVSIVGARKATQYSKAQSYTLASELKKRGVVTVSGGAMGIDIAAHNGAFPLTIAVFANSLDLIYPAVNRALIEKIYKDALALSEYEKNHKAHPFDFVLRNRIVVGLGEVLVIAEADEDSGSMRSAEIALESGKEIYVLPQRLGESKGTYKLLKEGAAREILDVVEFADRFGVVNSANDEVLEFCKNSTSLHGAVERFGDKIYEYELLGKIEIKNGKIKIL